LDDLKVGGNAFSDGRVTKPLDDPFSVLRFCNTSQEVGEVVLASGVLDMGKELGAFSHEVISSSEEISGGAHPGRIYIGLREHTASEQSSDLIVFGFSSVDRFHVEGMA